MYGDRHRRLHSTDADITCSSSTTSPSTPRSTQTLPNIQERSRKSHGSTCTMPSIGWRQGVLLGQLHGISPKGRNSARIHLPTYSATKRCSRAQKSAHPRSSAGHDEREAHAQVLLGRSCAYGRLPNEPVHNIRSARGHAARKILREEAGFIPLGFSARLHTCTYPTRSGKS